MQRKTATTVGMAMIAMAAAASTAHAQNLLVNGDFELFDPNDNYIIPGWTQASPGGPAGPDELGQHYDNTYSAGEFATTEGGRSFKAYAPYQQYGGSVGIQRVAATPGSTYTLTGKMFSPSGDFISSPDFAIIALGFLGANNASLGAATEVQFTNSSTPNTWIDYTITGVAPANAQRVNVVIGYIQMNANNSPTGPFGAVYYDDLSLTKVVVAAESNWIGSSSGGWTNTTNWQNGQVPNAVGAIANFGSSITGPSTVSISGEGVTAGTVRFNNAANSYTIGGSGALTLDVASGNAAITATAGSHAINASLVLNDSTVATVAASQTLTVGGAVTLANGAQLSSAGAGTLRINGTVAGSTGASIRANGGVIQANVDLGNGVDVRADAGEVRFGTSQRIRSLAVASGARASLTDTATASIIRTPSLTIAAGGTLDLGDNAAIIEYTGASPAGAVRDAIITGKAGGFDETGITSTRAAGDARYSVGYAEASTLSGATFAGETGYDNTTLMIRVTLRGDADLSGSVGFDDLVSLAQKYNQPGVWRDGDSDYSGIIDFADLVALAQNYNGTVASLEAAGLSSDFAADWARAQSLVPEPTSLLATLGVISLATRRRARTLA